MNNTRFTILESIAFENILGPTSFAHKITAQVDELKNFVHEFSSLAAIGEQLRLKESSYESENRKVLVEELKRQGNNPLLAERLLNPKSYTITTGHQLNLFSGPIYSIYKVASAIEIAQKAREKYPDKDFIPVFWMATEDHDVDEIDHFHLFGDQIKWKTEQQGPVGRFNLEGIELVIQKIKDKFRELPPRFEAIFDCYLNAKTLAEGHRNLFRELFSSQDILILDADSPSLKRMFVPYLINELNSNTKSIVELTNLNLEKNDLKNQAFARPINLFYLLDGKRIRIDIDSDKFFTIDNFKEWNRDELEQEIIEFPERFSPNVILRPLYQEVILPNLMYIGGAGELAYWIQLKGVFNHADVPYPLLQLRFSGLTISPNYLDKWTKLGFTLSDLFKDQDHLKKSYIKENDREMSFEEIDATLDHLYNLLQSKAEEINNSLHGYIAGEQKRTEKSIANIKGRILKLQKQQFDTQLNQIEKIKQVYFPDGILQERHQNILEILSKNPNFIEDLLAQMKTLDNKFQIMLV